MTSTLGLRLAEARQRIGLSQAELAARTGIAQTQISRYESGRSVPRRAALIKITEALQANIGWLLEGEQHQPPAPLPMKVAVEGDTASPELFVIPAALSVFVKNYAKNFNGSVPDALSDIILRFSAGAALTPTGSKEIPHVGALVQLMTDLQLRIQNLEAEISEINASGSKSS